MVMIWKHSDETANARKRLLGVGLAVWVAAAGLTSCGKKEAAAEQNPPAAVETPKVPEVATPAPKTAPPAPAAPDANPTASQARAASTQRQPGEAAAWREWDRAAERMREFGLTVRNSESPTVMEIDVGAMRQSEAQTVARTLFQSLGGRTSVIVYDGEGSRLAELAAPNPPRR